MIYISKNKSNMAPTKLHEFAVLLERDSQNTPWGIRLVGGSDFDTPLIITKVYVRQLYIVVLLTQL